MTDFEVHPPGTGTRLQRPYLSPGSREAIKHGCACPVIDNRYGRGIETVQGRLFWHAPDCPLHGVEE